MEKNSSTECHFFLFRPQYMHLSVVAISCFVLLLWIKPMMKSLYFYFKWFLNTTAAGTSYSSNQNIHGNYNHIKIKILFLLLIMINNGNHSAPTYYIKINIFCQLNTWQQTFVRFELKWCNKKIHVKKSHRRNGGSDDRLHCLSRLCFRRSHMSGMLSIPHH